MGRLDKLIEIFTERIEKCKEAGNVKMAERLTEKLNQLKEKNKTIEDNSK